MRRLLARHGERLGYALRQLRLEPLEQRWLLASDFGDAPLPYPTTLAENGAEHTLIGPALGANRDAESDGTHSTYADADPTANYLDAWIDFNGDGDWDDPGEQIFSAYYLGTSNGTQSLTFTVRQDTGENVVYGTTYARFRLSTSGGLLPTGLAGDGEVEDYEVAVTWFGSPEALGTNAASDSQVDRDPQVATDGLGNRVAVWQCLGGTPGHEWDILVSRSTDAGGTWTAAAPLNTNAGSDSGADFSPQVTTDGVGNWVAVWHSNSSLGGTIGTDEDILFATFSEILWDYGDAPSPYPTLLADIGARHLAVGPTLGTTRDVEPEGQPDPNALADDTAGEPDDEDGVTFTSVLLVGDSAAGVDIDLTASSVDGLLNAWGDFNADGDWADGDWADPGEQIFTDQPVTAGVVNSLSFAVPIGAIIGDTFARFRVSTQPGLSYTGAAPDGEVEDYRVVIVPNIIDDGDPQYASTAGWTPAAGPGTGYQDDSESAPAGASSETATWTLNLTPGMLYDVAATWVTDPTLATDV